LIFSSLMKTTVLRYFYNIVKILTNKNQSIPKMKYF
jgi:hypothetical protein